jgi:hypothetical protein
MPHEFDDSAARALPENVTLQLADLAHVSQASRAQFCELLGPAIELAGLGTQNILSGEPRARASDVAHYLRRVTSAARALNRELGVVPDESRDFGRRNAAAMAIVSLEVALKNAAGDEQDTTTHGFLPRLTAYQHWLATLIAAAAEAERSANVMLPTRRGKPTGAGGNLFFDIFVKNLHEIAYMTGGKWTHYRDPTSPGKIEWCGTLLQAIEILRPYLPARGFFPEADLGRCLEHVREKLKHHRY